MLPVYKIGIDLSDPETKIEYNSYVDYPAHMRAFEAYGKKKVNQYFSDNTLRRVTGVMIAADTLIYRNDPQLGEHYVTFEKSEIDKMWRLFCKQGRFNMLNRMHDKEDLVAGSYMIESWIVNPDRGMGVPKALEGQGIRPGSIMVTYQIENDEDWQKVKDGTFNGYSIEGVFLKWQVEVKKAGVSEKDRKIFRALNEIFK